jgi:hypothetical protein
MYTQLEALKRNLKEFVHNLNKKNLKVMDPNIDLRGMDPVDIWGENPIIPLEMAADKLVEGQPATDGQPLQQQREHIRLPPKRKRQRPWGARLGRPANAQGTGLQFQWWPPAQPRHELRRPGSPRRPQGV